MSETTAWRGVRDAGLLALRDGLRTGDFSDAPRDPLAAAEALTPGYPPTAQIQEAYLSLLASKDRETRTSYLTGLELQDGLLEAARRTAAVFRGTRGDALARTTKSLEDAPSRSDHLDDLLLSDDLPIGPRQVAPA
jgi:hypothetical protein